MKDEPRAEALKPGSMSFRTWLRFVCDARPDCPFDRDNRHENPFVVYCENFNCIVTNLGRKTAYILYPNTLTRVFKFPDGLVKFMHAIETFPNRRMSYADARNISDASFINGDDFAI